MICGVMFANQIFKMYTSMKKIQKDKDVEPTEFEQSVAQVPSFFQTCFSCPAEIVGKRVRFRLDGSKVIKVIAYFLVTYLDVIDFFWLVLHLTCTFCRSTWT